MDERDHEKQLAFEQALRDGKFEEWTRYADKLLKFSANGIAVSHLGPEDIVYNVVKAALVDDRTWDIERVQNIDAYVKTTIKSEVWNAKQKSKRSSSIDDLRPKDLPNDFESNKLRKSNKDRESKDFTIEFENKDLFQLCYDALSENEDHQLIFLAMKDFGYSDNKGIAEYYGTTADKVAYFKKEILKKLDKIIAQYKNN